MIGVCPVDFENIVTVTKYQKEPENLVVCVFGWGGGCNSENIFYNLSCLRFPVQSHTNWEGRVE